MKRSKRVHARVVPRAIALAAVMVFAGSVAIAADESETDHDLKVDWTNTFKYGAAARVKGQDPALVGNPVTSPNADDGDRNFGKGLISNRVEWLTELDAESKQGFGARVSALGVYDSVYNGSNSNPGFAGGAYPNQNSVPYNQFTNTTRDQMGRRLEIRDAFLFGKTDVGDMPLTARLGQHALLWGESLFFANNAIAGAQSAFDISRLLSDPTAQAKEFVLPVPQLSAQLQVSPSLTLGGYYQFRFTPNRLPAEGSYFSTSDIVAPGAEQLLLPYPLPAAQRTADVNPSNTGQYGLEAKWRVDETDLGLYAIRFHDKNPQQVSVLGGTPPQLFPTSYYLTYQPAITALGVSASRSFGDMNLAAEFSVHHNQDLASSGHAVDLSAVFGGPASNNTSNPAYAVGDTAHLNVSTIWSLQPSSLWHEATFVGEMAWNRLLKCTQSCSALDPNATRDAVSFREVFQPMYRQVVPGLDLGVPIGLGYTPKGSRSSLGPFGFPPVGGGDLTLGLSGIYNQVWRINLAYTHFFGQAASLLDATQSFSYQQTLADRDFVAFTVSRSF